MSKNGSSNPRPMQRAPVMDSYGCFNIRDFRKTDSVYFLDSSGQRHRGVVLDIDYERNLIELSSKLGDIEADVNDITFLDSYIRGWLD